MRATPTPDDAELLALGQLWQASAARERALDDALDAIADVHSPAYAAARDAALKEAEVGEDFRRRIVQLRAQTWPGVMLKIRLATWAYDFADRAFAETLKADARVTGPALTASLLRDLRGWFHPGPDAELLTLGKQFEQAWADYRPIVAEYLALPENATAADSSAMEKREEIAAGRVTRIAERIEALRATTLEGLATKMRACLWCHGGEPFDRDSFGEATDLRLVGSVFRDLMMIDGRPSPEAVTTSQTEERCHA